MNVKSRQANGMTIGMLAKATGVGIETIRYYQRIGLMSTPARSYGSVRRYASISVGCLRFIKRAQRWDLLLGKLRICCVLKMAPTAAKRANLPCINSWRWSKSLRTCMQCATYSRN